MPSSGTVRRLNIVVSADNQASDELQQVNEEADQVGESMEEADQQVDALRESFYALAGATTAVVGAMAAMTSLGASIDTTLATVRATSGATAEEMSMITSEIQAIGAEMPVTMTDVANAFRELSYAGFDAAESVAAVGAVTDVAIAGQLSIAESSRIVTSNLRAFNMEAEQAGAVASALGSTFAGSALTIQELGQALEYVAPVASTAGQSILEVSAALGVLADNGIRASRAGTGLQQFFSRLVRPTGRAEEAMSQLGLSTEDFLDSEGDFKDMHEMVATLSESMEGMSEAEQLQVLIDLFGQRGARSVAPLIDNVEELNQKIGEGAAADLKTAINDFSEMSAEEISEIDEQVSIDLRPNMSRDAVLREIMEASSNLSEEELATEVQFAFGVDERTAEILAADIAGGASVDELSSSLENATTEADIAAAQMETVGGQIEYLRGSMGSAAYTIYTGFRPALKSVFAVLIDLSDVITANEWALKTFGAALFVAVGGLAAMTGALGVALIQASLAGGALGTLATGLTATATGSFVLAAASKAASGAMFLMTASTSQLITAAWGLVPSLSGAAGALGSLRVGLMAAAGGLRAFFAALGPVGWAILGVSAALTAYSMNIFGFRDAVNSVLAPLGFLWDILVGVYDATRWLASAFVYLGKLGIGATIWTILAPFRALAWAIRATISAVSSLVGWFGELPALGKLVIGALFPPIAILWGLSEAFEVAREYGEAFIETIEGIRNLAGNWWSDLGMGIGDALRDATRFANRLLDPVRRLNDVFEGVADYVIELGARVHDFFMMTQKRIDNLPLIGALVDEPEGEWKTDRYGTKGQPVGGPEGADLAAMINGEQSAKGFADAFTRGLSAEQGQIATAMGDTTGLMAQWLPQSDAERGAFSNLTERGASLLDTLAYGAEQNQGVLEGVFGGLMAPMGATSVPDTVSVDGVDTAAPTNRAGGGVSEGDKSVSIPVDLDVHFDKSSDRDAARKTSQIVDESVRKTVQKLEDNFSMSRNAPKRAGGPSASGL